MSPWESSWLGFSRPTGSRLVPKHTPVSQLNFLGWPSWEECQRWANFLAGESVPEESLYGCIDLPLGGHLAFNKNRKRGGGEYGLI